MLQCSFDCTSPLAAVLDVSLTGSRGYWQLTFLNEQLIERLLYNYATTATAAAATTTTTTTTMTILTITTN